MVLKLRDRLLASPAKERCLSREEMIELAGSIPLAQLDLKDYLAFQEDHYARNRVYMNGCVELVVICWLPGQRSAVHDHGESNCLYRVVQGHMTEELFRRREDGPPELAAKRHWHRGDVTVSAGRDIHRISNEGTDHLVTIHLYSPPLDDAQTLWPDE